MDYKKLIFDSCGYDFDMDIEIYEADALEVSVKGTAARIGYKDIPQLCRGYMLAGMHKGEDIVLHQSPKFETAGAMLDMSRNGVLKVESVKKYLTCMASLGLNMLMLYTEDTYTVPEYPRLGYLRGRYSQEELREIDDYAAALGIEMIPCIQTLGHMSQFLKWNDAADLRDNGSVLLADYEPTYEFIEACIRSLRSCFRSKRIHIGLDETGGFSRGRFLEKFGDQPVLDVFFRHLTRVADICAKYDFKPMMWSDMIFHFISAKTNAFEGNLSEDQLAKFPAVDPVYWDYYETNRDVYKRKIDNHKQLGRETIFAGGIWTWVGHAPYFEHTLNTMRPALATCISEGIKFVFATVWGDDGAECNQMLSLGGLSLFSEYSYLDHEPTDDELRAINKAANLPDFDAQLAASKFVTPVGGKTMLWADAVYNLTDFDFAIENPFKAPAETLAAIDHTKTWSDVFNRQALGMRAAQYKYELIKNMRALYHSKDYEGLLEAITLAETAMQALSDAHEADWMAWYKPFGYETIQIRYGAQLIRLSYIKRQAMKLVSGEIHTIPELEEAILPGHGRNGGWMHLTHPSDIM